MLSQLDRERPAVTTSLHRWYSGALGPHILAAWALVTLPTPVTAVGGPGSYLRHLTFLNLKTLT